MSPTAGLLVLTAAGGGAGGVALCCSRLGLLAGPVWCVPPGLRKILELDVNRLTQEPFVIRNHGTNG